MKRIGLFVIVFFCISLLLHASGPRVLFIGDSITDGNWGNACGMPKPTAERSLWDMNHIYGSEAVAVQFSRDMPNWQIFETESMLPIRKIS